MLPSQHLNGLEPRISEILAGSFFFVPCLYFTCPYRYRPNGRDAMIPTLDFLLPSLHPSTLLDVSFPLTGPGSTGEPVVRQLSIKHNDHEPVGVVKRMLSLEDGKVSRTINMAFRIWAEEIGDAR